MQAIDHGFIVSNTLVAGHDWDDQEGKLAEFLMLDLVLMEVSELKLSERQEQFSIVFRGPSDAYLGQGIRPFHHERMGQFDLFIVPIRQDEKGFYYEAVFNRLPEPAETT